MSELTPREASDAETIWALLLLTGDDLAQFTDNTPPPAIIRNYIRHANAPQLRGLLIETAAQFYRMRGDGG